MSSKVARYNGLPDMVAMAGLFRPMRVSFTVDPLVWVPVVDVDVTRWMITFEDTGSGGLLVTPFPDDPPALGFVVMNASWREFKFVDYGSIVGMQWFAWNRGLGGSGTCFTQALNYKEE